MAMTGNSGRFLDDRESLQAVVDLMPDRQKAVYQGYGSMILISGFPNRKLVIYTVKGGIPWDISLLTLGAMEMTRTGGPTVEVHDDAGKATVTLNPVQWRGRDVFLQVPQNFIFRWRGKPTPAGGVQFAPHFAILVKTRSRVDKQADGDTFCETLNDFRVRYPGVQLKY